jgi:hypothetical protein
MSRKGKPYKSERSHDNEQAFLRRVTQEEYNGQRSDDSAKKSREAIVEPINRQLVKFTEQVRAFQAVAQAVDSRLKVVDEEMGGFKKKIRRQRKLTTDKLTKLDDQLRNDKLQSIQILALFVAFFTFVSVQFQLFAVVKDSFTMIALSMVLLGALLLFVCLTHLGIGYFRQDSPKNFKDWVKGLMFKGLFWVGLIAVIVLGLGLYLARAAQENTHAQSVQLQSVCKELGTKTEEAITKQLPTGDFLKTRYEHECTDAWMGGH